MAHAAGPDETVTTVATRMGSFELGRFSHRYQAFRGNTVNDTGAQENLASALV
jgi:hypothetical protein